MAAQEVTAERAPKIELATKGHANNKNLRHMCKVLITTSNFGPVCKHGPTTLPDNLVGRLRGYKDVPDVKEPAVWSHNGGEGSARLCPAVSEGVWV